MTDSTVDSRVLTILRECPQTRFDDMLLILEYYNRYSSNPHFLGCRSFDDVLLNYREYGLPRFETIRRARQRLQSCLPEISRNLSGGTEKEPLAVINIY